LADDPELAPGDLPFFEINGGLLTQGSRFGDTNNRVPRTTKNRRARISLLLLIGQFNLESRMIL